MYLIKKRKIEDEKRTLREHQNHKVLMDKEMNAKCKSVFSLNVSNCYNLDEKGKEVSNYGLKIE